MPGWVRVSAGDGSWGLRWSWDASKGRNQGGLLHLTAVPLEAHSPAATHVLISNHCYLPLDHLLLHQLGHSLPLEHNLNIPTPLPFSFFKRIIIVVFIVYSYMLIIDHLDNTGKLEGTK